MIRDFVDSAVWAAKVFLWLALTYGTVLLALRVQADAQNLNQAPPALEESK